MRLPRSAWILLCGVLFLTMSCGDEEEAPVGPPDGKDRLVLTLSNFGDPSPYHFALWAIDGANASLVLRFTARDGAPVTLAGEPIPSIDQERALGSADRLLLTLESDTLGAAPGPHRMMGGAVSENGATLALADAGGLGADLSGAAGFFLFDTPSTPEPADCGRGIWWTDGGGAPGLVLPALAGAWTYEGWVIDRNSGAAYSTGRFDGPTGADSDGAGQTAGPEAGYDFPGQDFVRTEGNIPPLDLDGGSFAAAVTLEPDPDLSDDPFFLKLLDKNAGSGNLFFTVSTLPRAPQGLHYEIWAAYPDTLVSVGKFLYVNRRVVDVETGVEIAAFPIGSSLVDASAIRISLQNPADGPEPSGSFLLAGSLSGGVAVLSTDEPLALGHAYTETTARYILETPSTADPGDRRRGIWFYEVQEGETTGTLPIPAAPSGWKYQAWIYKVFGAPDTVSIGAFVDPLGPDGDGAGPHAGPDGPIPPFPGQDFVSGSIRNLDDGGYGVLVSLEPEDDPAPGSPYLRIFEDIDIDEMDPGVAQTLGSLSMTLPAGTARAEAARVVTMRSLGALLPRAVVSFGRK